MLTLKDEVATHHTRLLAQDRPCDKCLKPPAPGETLQIAALRFAAGTVIFSICDRCASAEHERFKDHLMSHDAASIFLCQQDQGIGKLSEELVAMNEWITKHSGPGQTCDECGCQLDGEKFSTAAAGIRGSVSDRSVLHIVCSSCKDGSMLNIRTKCDKFLARLVSTRATAFIPDLINPQTVVN
jgi:hypothetical protein